MFDVSKDTPAPTANPVPPAVHWRTYRDKFRFFMKFDIAPRRSPPTALDTIVLDVRAPPPYQRDDTDSELALLADMNAEQVAEAARAAASLPDDDRRTRLCAALPGASKVTIVCFNDDAPSRAIVHNLVLLLGAGTRLQDLTGQCDWPLDGAAFDRLPDTVCKLNVGAFAQGRWPTRWPAALADLALVDTAIGSVPAHTLPGTVRSFVCRAASANAPGAGPPCLRPGVLPAGLERFLCLDDVSLRTPGGQPVSVETGALPDGLVYLAITGIRWMAEPAALPASLHTLLLGSNEAVPRWLPSGLRALHIGSLSQSEMALLPAGLRRLTCARAFEFPNPRKAGRLPAHLGALNLRTATTSGVWKACMLPRALDELTLPDRFNGGIPRGGGLPDTVRRLEFGRQFVGTSRLQLPHALETLVLGRSFDAERLLAAPDQLPPGLHTVVGCKRTFLGEVPEFVELHLYDESPDEVAAHPADLAFCID